jgi:hypothetical protein
VQPYSASVVLSVLESAGGAFHCLISRLVPSVWALVSPVVKNTSTADLWVPRILTWALARAFDGGPVADRPRLYRPSPAQQDCSRSLLAYLMFARVLSRLALLALRRRKARVVTAARGGGRD